MSKPPTQLVRGLGVLAGLALTVGNMIGTGLFLKSRVMICNVGSPMLVLAIWVIAGLAALIGSMCLAELSAMIPETGGSYAFFQRAFGRSPAYIYGWASFAILRSGSQAAIAVGLAIFLNVALGGVLGGNLFETQVAGVSLHVNGLMLVAVGTIALAAFLCSMSVVAGGRTATVLTAIKVAFAIGVGVAALALGRGDWSQLWAGASGATCEGVNASARGGVAGFGAAMLGALWGYSGWENAAPLAGEVRDPARNLPRIFLLGTLLVLVVYVAVNATYFYVLGPVAVGSVPAQSSLATEVLRALLGPFAVTLVAVGLIFSSFGALQSSLLANSRIPFAMARDGLFFRGLAQVSTRTHVPVRAVLAQAGWAILLALSGTYDTLTDSVIFADWLFFGLMVVALFRLRRTMPEASRPYRVWGYPVLPALFLIIAGGLFINTFVATPRQAFLGVGLIALGLPLYYYWRKPKPS